MSQFTSLIARIFGAIFARPTLPKGEANTATPAGPATPPAIPNLEQALSQHFSLAELSASNMGTRHGLDNTPGSAEIANLKRLSATLEQVRAQLYNAPLQISSGYRSPRVNALVGGAANSAHLQGLAADFIAPGYGRPSAIAKAINASGIAFDQLIFEGSWVHLAIAPLGQGSRGEVLTATFSNGKAIYSKGITA